MTVEELQEIRNRVQPLIAEGRFEELEQQVEPLRAGTSDLAIAYCHHVDGLRVLEEGSVDDSLEHFNRAMDIYAAAKYHDGIASILLNMGNAYANQRNESEALTYWHKGLAVAEELSDTILTGMLLHNIGAAHQRLLSYDTAITYIRQALQIFRDIADTANECVALSSLAQVYFLIGDARAEEISRTAIDKAHQEGMTIAEWTNLRQLFDYKVDKQEFAEADVLLQRMEALVQHKVNAGTKAMTLQRRSILASLTGDLEAAATALSAFESVGWTDQLSEAARALATGHYLLAGQQYEAAREQLEAAVQSYQAIDLEVQAERCFTLLQQVAKSSGDFDLYVKYTEAAKRSFERLHGVELALRAIAMEREQEMQQERLLHRRHRDALYATLPRHVADRVARGESVTDQYESASVLFLDLVGFTALSSTVPPSELVALLERAFSTFDGLCRELNVTKVKTIGDAYLAIAVGEHHQQRIAAAAIGMAQHVRTIDGVDARVGLHCGPLVAGVVGTERLQYDVWGDTVNVASRMESTGEPGRIQVSESFASALGNGEWGRGNGPNHDSPFPIPYSLRERGAVDVKGKGTMTTLWLEF